MAELKVRASLDGAQFQSGLNKMGSAAGGVLGGIKSQIAAAFTVGAVTALASKTMAYADSIQEMGQRIGVSSRALQEWSFAAKQSGADTEKMVTFIERLTDAASDLKNAKGFAAIGINPAGMTPEQLFTSVQGKTAGKSSTEIQSMMQGLGLSIKQIGPMVNMLQDDLAAASESARKMGAVMDDATVNSLAKLNDQLSIMGQILMAQFGPALLEAGKIALRMFGTIKGGVGYFGAMTAKMSAQDMILGPFLSKKEQQKIYDKSKPDAAIIATAKNEWATAMEAIDEMMRKLANYQPPAPSTINPTNGTEPNRRTRAGGGDSLTSVGNFLGAGRNVVESIAKEQLRVQKEIASSTKILADASKKTPGTITV